jgi:hypothetical protein
MCPLYMDAHASSKRKQGHNSRMESLILCINLKLSALLKENLNYWADTKKGRGLQTWVNLTCLKWSRFQRVLYKIFMKIFQTLIKTRGSAHWACIAHLTIEWYWSKFQREIIITLKNSSHLGMEGGAVGHNFERDTPRDHLCQVWLHLAKLFQRRRFF